MAPCDNGAFMSGPKSQILHEDLHDRVPITRLQVLADVIFAASMVYMASAFELPDTNVVDSPSELTDFLKDQLPIVAIYVISFVLVAVYWMKHLEHFSYLRKTNIGHLWLQILFLAMVVVSSSSNFSSTSRCTDSLGAAPRSSPRSSITMRIGVEMTARTRMITSVGST